MNNKLFPSKTWFTGIHWEWISNRSQFQSDMDYSLMVLRKLHTVSLSERKCYCSYGSDSVEPHKRTNTQTRELMVNRHVKTARNHSLTSWLIFELTAQSNSLRRILLKINPGNSLESADSPQLAESVMRWRQFRSVWWWKLTPHMWPASRSANREIQLQ